MTNESRQRPMRVRVEYEPNRFSQDCLEKIYAQLHPTKSRPLSPDKNSKQGEFQLKKEKGASNEQR